MASEVGGFQIKVGAAKWLKYMDQPFTDNLNVKRSTIEKKHCGSLTCKTAHNGPVHKFHKKELGS